MLYAHSPDEKRCIKAQGYAEHVSGVVTRANDAARAAAQYASIDGQALMEVVAQAAQYHDLGKLDLANQVILSGKCQARSLPIQHTDAGTAHLLHSQDQSSLLAAVLVCSHHKGLPDFIDESNRGSQFLRDTDVSKQVDETLSRLLADHESILPAKPVITDTIQTGDPSVFLRIALSCLADADHTDTAIHYHDYPSEEIRIELKPLERLQALDSYVKSLSQPDNERSLLRDAMYESCRNAIIDSNIASCQSPVGTGKTTAIMAHLLFQAAQRGLRHIFIILPFTNIITQSVEVYRKSLVLPGENPEDIVAELHHRADFQSVEARALTALWKAPIIVTTAVAFFETLASCSPSTLRRLHNLPGSAVFIDEAHAALPTKLLPLAWDWIKIFSREWSTYWVLASGSLNRFWTISEIDKQCPKIPEIVGEVLQEKLVNYERKRVIYKYREESLTVNDLVDWIVSLPGPRIVVVNTVQNAAVIASLYAQKYGRGQVEHLSTALTPIDRESTLKRVKSRLTNKQYENNEDWTLVATSCVEAGIDISFRTGLRELGSLVSLLQLAGRVNRPGIENDSEVWTFRLAEDDLLKENPSLVNASKILKSYFEKGMYISPTLCTAALKDELALDGSSSVYAQLRDAEQARQFPLVENKFKVINVDTRPVVISQDITIRLKRHDKVSWKEIQKNSVQVWKYKLDSLHIPEIGYGSELYAWNLNYDDFLGYMAGVLAVERFSLGKSEAMII